MHAFEDNFDRDPAAFSRALEDAYRLLRREKRRRYSFSQVVRRLVNERSALTADELLEALKPFEGVGAGRKRHAAA